jgi:hypothetical protein
MERTSKRQVSSYGGRNEELTKMREEETEMMVEEEEDPLISHIFVFAHTCCPFSAPRRQDSIND